jgi:hypothetical protein
LQPCRLRVSALLSGVCQRSSLECRRALSWARLARTPDGCARCRCSAGLHRRCCRRRCLRNGTLSAATTPHHRGVSACLSVCLSVSQSVSLSLFRCQPRPRLITVVSLPPSLSLSHTHTHTHTFSLSLSLSAATTRHHYGGCVFVALSPTTPHHLAPPCPNGHGGVHLSGRWGRERGRLGWGSGTVRGNKPTPT